MKPGRVCIMLAGRRAGKKCVIVKSFEDGKKGGKAYPHALVAGVERSPLKVHKKMSEKKIARRSKVKPFVKLVNYNHLLPTRFKVTGEFASGGKELKQIVTEDRLEKAENRKKLKNEIKTIFNERYNKPSDTGADENENSGQTAVDFFFKKLRF
jgi:large subunit ribosomal protein L27e